MTTGEHPDIRLISSDLNGTLVHQHTMMDMIRLYFPHEPERYDKAREAFAQQTSGTLSMRETFAVAGPLTKGLRLRDAIGYAWGKLDFLPGFEEMLRALHQERKCFIINSTGYSVTTEVLKLRFGPEKFTRVICNHLVFGWEGEPQRRLTNGELLRAIDGYEGQPSTLLALKLSMGQWLSVPMIALGLGLFLYLRSTPTAVAATTAPAAKARR